MRGVCQLNRDKVSRNAAAKLAFFRPDTHMPLIKQDTVSTDRAWPDFDPQGESVQPLLKKNMGRFFPASGSIDTRNEALLQWIQRRAAAGLWPYGLCAVEPPAVECRVRHSCHQDVEGVNLTMVDYLGLSQDARLKAAAIEAIETFGLHLPSSGPLMGNTEMSYDLERSVARLFGRQDAFLLPTGWAAGFGAVSGVVRPGDYVLMDELSHQCLQQGAYASTANVSVFRHLDNDHLESQLAELRAKDPSSAILIITEGLFSMDGDTPNLREVVALARRFGAQTLVDIAHDFGCTGPSGTGTLGAQEVMNDIDIVVGSFSKSFGTNGGFISSRTLSMQWAQLCFAGPYTFSTAISPVQVAAAAAALQIVTGPEGDVIRATLRERVAHARDAAARRGLTVIGATSPIVPVLIGREQHSRLAGMYSFRRGLIATCLEFPVVQRGTARYRLSMSPRLSHAQIDTAMDIVADSIAEAKRVVD